MTSISATGTTIFIRDNSGTIEYKIGSGGSWIGITFPLTITNNNPINSSILTIELTTDLSITSINDYFTINSNYITFDGKDKTVLIDTVSNYDGLIKNNSYSYIEVKNVIISSSTSTLSIGAGWIGFSSYGTGSTNCTFTSCYSDGPISQYGGGILGQNNYGCTITLCYSTGNIDQYGGGIVGSNADNITITKCFSLGSIGSYGGGIAGANCGDGSSITADIENCYSLGYIGENAGGICGVLSGSNSGTITIQKCYSFGYIDQNAGGIIGSSAGSSSGFATIVNCYSLGNINTNGGGICGALTGASSGMANISHCYTIGSLGASAGGIVGAGSTGAIVSNCFSEGAFGSSSWSNTNANTTLTNVGTVWINKSIPSNSPYLLLAFNSNFYNGSTTASVTLGSGNYTSLTTTGTGTEYLLISSGGVNNPDITVSNSSPYKGQFSSVYDDIPPSYDILLVVLNGNPSGDTYYGYNIMELTLTVNNPVCYLEGTKILCYIDNKDQYIPIQNITKDTLVKTYKYGYKKVINITKLNLDKYDTSNNIINKLYVMKKDKNKDLIEDLYITGAHSILVKKIPAKNIELIKKKSNGYRLHQIKDKYLYPAYANDKFELVNYNDDKTINTDSKYYIIYHLVLENNDIYKNYGIWANGILSESLPIVEFK